AGDVDGSLAAHQEALAELRGTGEAYHSAYALMGLGFALGLRGKFEEAVGPLKEAIRMRVAVRDHVGLAAGAEVLGWHATALGDAERGAVLMGAAARLSARSGMSVITTPALVGQHDAWSRRAAELLGATAFDRAFRRGSAMSLEDAVA